MKLVVGLLLEAIPIAVFPPHAIAIAAAVLGAAGGVCVGLYLIYDSSLLPSPIVRRLPDEDAVQRFIRDNQG